LATASKFSIVRLRARFGWLDYHADVAGGLPVAQYISGHVEIGGIVMPRHRRALLRKPDGHVDWQRPPGVSIDFTAVEVACIRLTFVPAKIGRE